MREILYRGKRVDNSEWVYGYFWERKGYASYIKVLDANGNLVGDYEVVKTTVGQYIGQTDKNGNKIFENDIVEGDIRDFEYAEAPYYFGGAVEFGEGSYDKQAYTGFYFRNPNGLVEGNVLCKHDIDIFNIKILGNIYDNPKLLKACQKRYKRNKD